MSKFDRTDSVAFYNEMIELGKRGLSLAECGDYHGVLPEDWQEWCEEHKLTEIWHKRGKAQGLALAGEQLLEQIQAGKINAITFYLKTKGTFTEKTVDQLNETLKCPYPTMPTVPSDPTEAASTYRDFMKNS